MDNQHNTPQNDISNSARHWIWYSGKCCWI